MQEGAGMATDGLDRGDWNLRPLILAGLGLAAGVVFHALLGSRLENNVEAWRAALLIGVALGAALVGFTLERRLWWASILFSVGVAIVAALVVYWNGAPGGWSASECWRTISLLLSIAIAAPLFQAARDEGAMRFPYASVHDHAWTNVVLWCACWLFVAIVFALSWLLAALFDLIKIDLLRRLLEKDWFWRALIGLAFGAGLGLLRENDTVVRLLQRVVATVLAVLAPVLAIGLALFLLALPFTGLDALWDATRATTPILLSCVIGALILANAVIGNMPEHERSFPLLRYGAMLLAAVVLPLAIIAAIATGLRIGQYGFTPERLWAVVFVALASLYGAAYLAALVLGRLGWAARARPMNLRLAFATCGVALLLATPLVSFNAISTRDQLARLESGRVTPDRFDWAALAFDFGEPGRAATQRLSASGTPEVRAAAARALKTGNRYELAQRQRAAEVEARVAGKLRVVPRQVALPDGLVESFTNLPDDPERSVVHYQPGGDVAVLVTLACERCLLSTEVARRDAAGRWSTETTRPTPPSPTAEESRAVAQGLPTAPVDIRTVTRRQMFVDGKPVGDVFE